MLLAHFPFLRRAEELSKVLVFVGVYDCIQAVFLPGEELCTERSHRLDGQEVTMFYEDLFVLGEVPDCFY